MLVPDGAKAGKISKPYGLRGEVNIILEPEAGTHMEANHPLFIDIDGQRVPFFIEEMDLVSRDQAIVKFEFIDSVEEARAVQGCMIYFDPKYVAISEGQADDLASLVGYRAFDREAGELGTISGFIPQEMNPVLVIDHQGNELMVPATPDFIGHIDSDKREVHFFLPDGLLSL